MTKYQEFLQDQAMKQKILDKEAKTGNPRWVEMLFLIGGVLLMLGLFQIAVLIYLNYI